MFSAGKSLSAVVALIESRAIFAIPKAQLLGALCATLAVLPFSNANAVIIDHGSFVSDPATGLDWLDLTATAGLSYNDVSAQLGTGGAFEGWRYATVSELSTLWTAFGGNDNYYSGWSTQNDGLFETISPVMGDLGCDWRQDPSNTTSNPNPSPDANCTTGAGFSHWITADLATTADAAKYSINEGERLAAVTYNFYIRDESLTMDYINLKQLTQPDNIADPEFGSALLRVSAVPVPASVWLFGSGILGLTGIARRKKSA